MATPRYKIRIINTAIGDPFLLGKFYFDTDGYSNPTEDPVAGLQIKVEFSVDGDSFPDYGLITLSKPIRGWQMENNGGTVPTYHFGLPFDPGSDYVNQQTIYLRLTFSCTNGDIELGDGTNNHETFTMAYSDTLYDVSVTAYYYWSNED